MPIVRPGLCLLLCFSVLAEGLARADQIIEPAVVHLRSGEAREWASFPEQSPGNRLSRSFESQANTSEWTLAWRQRDVKEDWILKLNGKVLANLERDENDRVLYIPILPGGIAEGKNELVIEPRRLPARVSDDISVGEIRLVQRPVSEVLQETRLELRVVDAQTGQAIPARITVLNAQHALQHVGVGPAPVGSEDSVPRSHLAVRAGTIYTATGEARFGLPAGQYTVYAGHGFEYSLTKIDIAAVAGETIRKTLTIHREVDTAGYVACDPHVHTLTHSGHGDATVEERMITLAAEGIELPIATDHNVQIDHAPFARTANVRQHFTPVIGNEVTTPVGHFNIFPVAAGAAAPPFRQDNWPAVFNAIRQVPGVQAVILNHARDIHSGVRPFDPVRYNALVGENLDGWPIAFNAMEVINSGATQTNPMQLCHDWMGLLNRGYRITPVGSSDSHDVSRYIVGQGRTYIRCDDNQPGAIDSETAAKNFSHGRVLVSYGLLTELTIEDKYHSGETAPVAGDSVRVSIRVQGPHWAQADRIQLFANGQLIREAEIGATSEALPRGTKWSESWVIPKPRHDVHLVAIASGPGVKELYWPFAKPYQPTSIEYEPRCLGCSGAVWLDSDGDGQSTSARGYAEALYEQAAGKLPRLVQLLADHDAAVAAHVAHLYFMNGGSLEAEDFRAQLQSESPAIQTGLQNYVDSRREHDIARLKR